MALSEHYVEHDDGRRGVVVGDGPHCFHKVVNMDTCEEELWNMQEMLWPYLVPGRQVEAPAPGRPRS